MPIESFISRQAILDGHKSLWAFQLRHRSAPGEKMDADTASKKLIADISTLLGVNGAIGKRKTFVPVSRDVLINQYPQMLPSIYTIVEVPATIEQDQALIDACRSLKEKGYEVALGNVSAVTHTPLLALVDYVKVDLGAVPKESLKTVTQPFMRLKKCLVAENAADWQVYRQAVAAGFTYVAGDYLGTPAVVLVAKEGTGYRHNNLQLLMEVNRPDISFEEIETVIKRDPNLSYRLLQYVNSAFHGVKTEVTSIRHAVVLLGERELRRWASLVVLTSIASNKPEELLLQATLRARFAELLAPLASLGNREQEMFLLGLLSLLEAILDAPIRDIVKPLPLTDELKAALIDRKGPLGKLLSASISYLDGDWPAFLRLSSEAGLAEAAVPQAYIKAVDWVQKSFSSGLQQAA
jgi:EAL and modified HD-GYP domain-containing signal transduction protein